MEALAQTIVPWRGRFLLAITVVKYDPPGVTRRVTRLGGKSPQAATKLLAKRTVTG